MGWILAVASDFGIRHVARRRSTAPSARSVGSCAPPGHRRGGLIVFGLGLVLTGSGGAYGPAILLLALVYAINRLTEF
jgi:hypothetical protein